MTLNESERNAVMLALELAEDKYRKIAKDSQLDFSIPKEARDRLTAQFNAQALEASRLHGLFEEAETIALTPSKDERAA